MAEPRRWPAVEVRSPGIDDDGALGDLVAATLHDHAPLAVQDLIPPPLPPGGLWDPTAPPPPEPPPTPLAWRICFGDVDTRDRAAEAIDALALGLSVDRVDLPDDDWVARSQQSLTGDQRRPLHRGAAVGSARDAAARRARARHRTLDGIRYRASSDDALCLAAMSALPFEGRTVLDLGTGSGVLAMAASVLGAREVRGVDIDADAIEAAIRSAALNTLPTRVAFDTADVFAVPSAPADVVLANLTGAMLIRAAAPLAAMVVPGGTLVVSGFMHYERDGVEAALDAFDVVSRTHEDEWCADVLRRR